MERFFLPIFFVHIHFIEQDEKRCTHSEHHNMFVVTRLKAGGQVILEVSLGISDFLNNWDV